MSNTHVVEVRVNDLGEYILLIDEQMLGVFRSEKEAWEYFDNHPYILDDME